MRIGFLILAHKYPHQLIKLINSLLKYENSTIILHIDLKAEALYQEICDKYSKHNKVLVLKNRYKVYWGSFNQIRATLELIKEGVTHNLQYYCLLSGQDIPIQPINKFAHFLEQNIGAEYLVNFKLPSVQWEEGGINRLALYYFDVETNSVLLKKISSLVLRIQRFTGFKRKIKHELYGGANWFTLSNGALGYVCEYLEKNPSYLSSFKFSRCADEIFLQTILLNSSFKPKIVSESLRVVDWSSGPEFPKIFKTNDFEKLMRMPGKFFARKFDETVDDEIIDKLHSHV